MLQVTFFCKNLLEFQTQSFTRISNTIFFTHMILGFCTHINTILYSTFDLNYMIYVLMFSGGAPTSICHFFCLSVRPSICLSVHPSVCLSVCLSVRSSIRPSICLSVAHHISRALHHVIIIFGTHV